MRLTKLGHACVRLEKKDARLVIDPGMFTEPTALDGADAVLVTHEHLDHFAEGRLRTAADGNPALRIWANRSVAGNLTGLNGRVTVVGHGDTFSAGGFDVTVHGELHEVIHPDIPRITNIGFLVDGTVFHPGDAFTVPAEPVDTLMLPVHGPWSRLSQVIDYLREVKPTRAFAVHDGLLNDTGLSLVDRMLGAGGPGTGTDYTRLSPGKAVVLS